MAANAVGGGGGGGGGAKDTRTSWFKKRKVRACILLAVRDAMSSNVICDLLVTELSRESEYHWYAVYESFGATIPLRFIMHTHIALVAIA